MVLTSLTSTKETMWNYRKSNKRSLQWDCICTAKVKCSLIYMGTWKSHFTYLILCSCRILHAAGKVQWGSRESGKEMHVPHSLD